MRRRFLIIIMPLLFLFINTTLSGQIKVTNEGRMVVKDDQLIIIKGDFDNKSSFFTNRGDFSLTGNFRNEAKVSNPGNGILRFVGVQDQTFFLLDSMEVFDMEINNPFGLTIAGDHNVRLFSDMNFTDGLVFTNINSLLAFQPNSGYVFGGSPDISHIEGPTTKTGSENFIFPIGKGGFIRRSGIENLTESGTFLSEYFDFGHFDLNTDMTLFNVSNEEYWEISRVQGNANAGILLHYDDAIGGFDDINDVQIAYFNNPWTRVNSDYDPGGSPTFFASDNAVTEFGLFTFSKDELVQPAVVLEAFQNDDCFVELNWIVPPGTEVNLFEIEVSFDSINYTKIGEVAGDTLPTTSFEIYQFFDYELYDNEKLFYRVKILQPGSFTYFTPVATIDNECIFKHCSIFPNPVSSKANLNLRMTSEFEQNLTLRIYDVPGRILLEQEVQLKPGNNQYPIFTKDLNLASGMYFLQVAPRKSLKFVVIYD